MKVTAPPAPPAGYYYDGVNALRCAHCKTKMPAHFLELGHPGEQQKESVMTTATKEREQTATAATTNKPKAPTVDELRAALGTVFARLEVYDSNSVTEADAKGLYTDGHVAVALLTLAMEDIRREQKWRREVKPILDSLDRLNLNAYRTRILEAFEQPAS